MILAWASPFKVTGLIISCLISSSNFIDIPSGPQLFLGCNLSIIFRMFSSFVYAKLNLWEVGFPKKFLNDFELGSFMLAARFGPILTK